jgi:hypothetical protein
MQLANEPQLVQRILCAWLSLPKALFGSFNFVVSKLLTATIKLEVGSQVAEVVSFLNTI